MDEYDEFDDEEKEKYVKLDFDVNKKKKLSKQPLIRKTSFEVHPDFLCTFQSTSKVDPMEMIQTEMHNSEPIDIEHDSMIDPLKTTYLEMGSLETIDFEEFITVNKQVGLEENCCSITSKEIIDPDIECNLQSSSKEDLLEIDKLEPNTDSEQSIIAKNEFKGNGTNQQLVSIQDIDQMDVSSIIETTSELKVEDNEAVEEESDDCPPFYKIWCWTGYLPEAIELYIEITENMSPFTATKWNNITEALDDLVARKLHLLRQKQILCRIEELSSKKCDSQQQKVKNERKIEKLKQKQEESLSAYTTDEVVFLIDIGYFVMVEIEPIYVPLLHISGYVSLINCVISLLEGEKFSTKKMIFNWDKDNFHNKDHFNFLLRNLCISLGVRESDLNIIDKPKGNVAGDLYFYENVDHDFGHNLIHYSCPITIPKKISLVKLVESGANFILVVEKGDIFRELVNVRDIRQHFNVIILTSDGYPNKQIREFVQKLFLELKIPVFVLADGDPCGINVVSAFRYGSPFTLHENLSMNVSFAKWLGVNADDIEYFKLTGEPYDDDDLKRFDALLKKEHIIKEKEWHDQIIKMIKLNVKVKLVPFAWKYPRFLLEEYLPYKISRGKWY